MNMTTENTIRDKANTTKTLLWGKVSDADDPNPFQM